MLLTSAQEESAEQLLELYRGRWQIERYFKELKSLGGMVPPQQLSREGRAMGWARTFWVGELMYQNWLGIEKVEEETRWKALEQSWRIRQLMWPTPVAALWPLRHSPAQTVEQLLSAPVQLQTHGKDPFYRRLRDRFAA